MHLSWVLVMGKFTIVAFKLLVMQEVELIGLPGTLLL